MEHHAMVDYLTYYGFVVHFRRRAGNASNLYSATI